MDSFLKNVDGCTLTLKDFHSSISFPTPSDAMLASLILKYAHMTMNLFDDLFALFNHKDFRSDDLRMGHTEEILDHISKQRLALMVDREGKRRRRVARCPQSDHNGYSDVPSLVIESVVDHLDSERTPFHRIPTALRPNCEADNTLREMCLVQRSWANAAQRGLRKRIWVRGRYEIALVLQSPQLGPWVRDLSIITQKSSEELSGPEFVTNYNDRPRFMCEILRKCPNVVNLHLQDFLPVHNFNTPSTCGPFDVITKLGDLIFLEHLWLEHVYNCAVTDLPRLCMIIPHLRQLKSLNLNSWAPMEAEEEIDKRPRLIAPASSSIDPIRSLESLSISQVSDADPIGQLLGSSPQYTPKALELSCSDMRAGHMTTWVGLPPFVEPILPFVTKLILNDYQGGDDIASAAARFPSLEFLRLCLFYGSMSPIPVALPSSITSLHIHYTSVPNLKQNSVLIDTLIASPRVRKLLITYEDYEGNWLTDLPSSQIDFDSTMGHCKMNGVDFELGERKNRPSIFDL